MMDPGKNLRFVEGQEKSTVNGQENCNLNGQRNSEGSCELVEEEIDVIAAQKNRERFAIKKTYSVEVILKGGFVQAFRP